MCTGISFSARPSARQCSPRRAALYAGSYREAFLRGHNRLATLPALGTLLDITRDLLAWQVEHDRPVDDHYLKGIFRLAGENWMEEFDRFRAALRPVVDQMYAEHLLRPLESDCFELADIPDANLSEIFTLPRLKTIFPLVLRGLGWTEQKATALAQELRPVISAVTETIGAGTLRLDIRIDGQPRRTPGAGTHAPSAPADHRPGLRGAVRLGGVLRTAGPVHAVFPPSGSPARTVTKGACDVLPARACIKEGFFGIDGLRIFLPAEAFETLVRELTTRCAEGTLAEALTGLRGLYGDL